MKIKKFLIGVTMALFAATNAACSNSRLAPKSSDGYTPKELNVQFVPSVQASKPEARAKPLQGLLEKQLHMPVHVTVSTDNSTLVEAMASKKVDAGFLPPDVYILAHKRGVADVLLQTQCYGYDEPSDKQNHRSMDSYRSMIVAKKGSKIKSWRDLKGKTIVVQDPISTSGYVLPVVELYKKGLNVPKDCKLVQVKGYDQAVSSVYNGDVDVTFVFPDARPLAAKDAPAVMKDVVLIYLTKYVPNDTVSVRSSMSKSFRKKLAKAFKNIARTREGKKILGSIYRHYGYVDPKDSGFNTAREYEAEVKKVQK